MKTILKQVLSKEYNYRFYWNHTKLVSVLIAFQIILYLLVFRPFGLQFLLFIYCIPLAICYGIIGGLSFYISLKLSKSNRYKHWTLAKDILLALITMIFASVLIYISTYIFKNYTFTYFIQHDRILTYRESLLYSFIIGVFIYVFIKVSDDYFYRLEVQYKNKGGKKDTMISVEEEIIPLIELEGKNKDENIKLNPNYIVHIEAQGNYAKIVYQIELEEEVTKSEVFRTSITELLEQLSEFNFLYCCHRSHIINLNYITNVTGNSKSMNVEIKMPSYVASVSVSRLKISEFLDLWEKHQKK